jgi:hypothetical protein
MAFQAVGEMMLRNKKSREGWISESIAGNHLSLPIFRISAAEGVVLHNYGINRVAQLFGVNDLNGRIDLKMNGSEVEGGVFTEELVIRYPLLITKCNSLRRAIAGERLPVGPAPQGPFLKTCLNGKFSSLHRKWFREERRVGSQVPPPTTLGGGLGYRFLSSTNLCTDTEFC